MLSPHQTIFGVCVCISFFLSCKLLLHSCESLEWFVPILSVSTRDVKAQEKRGKFGGKDFFFIFSCAQFFSMEKLKKKGGLKKCQ